MNVWLVAVLALLPAFATPTLAACRGDAISRFVAVQLCASIAILVLTLLTFGFDQSSFMDLPLCAAFLNLPGSLLIAMVLERWL